MPDFRAHIREHLPSLRISGAREAEVIEELALELEERYENEIRGGTEPGEAWRKVTGAIEWSKLARDFSTVLRDLDEPASGRASPALWNDIRFAFRLLVRNPVFAATVILTIALGIGPNTAIFSILHAVFWAPGDSPIAKQRTVLWSVHGNERGFGVRGGIHVSPRDYLEWRREASSFERMDAVIQREVTLNDDTDNPERIQIQSYTPGAISRHFAMPMALGRDFLEEEGLPGKDIAVVLSHRFWQQRYNGDPKVLGRQIRLDGRPYTIVGVLAAGWWDRRREPLWTSLAVSPEMPGYTRQLTVLAIRKPGVTMEQAQAEMNAIAVRLGAKYPDTNGGWTVRADVAKNSWLNERTSSNLWMLMGAVSLVLLIACLNVANLLLARGSARLKEIAVRVSMGAGKWHIVVQLMTESLILSLLGGLAGIGLSWAMLKMFLGLAPRYWVPPSVDIHISFTALLFTLLASILAGLIFGCAPAWQLAGLGIAESLRSSGRAGVGFGKHFWGRALVVTEIALALTLLAAAGMVLRSYWTRMHADSGVLTTNILTFELPVRPGRLKTQEEIVDYNRVLKERIEAVPGVDRLTAIYGVPLQETGGTSVAVARRVPADLTQYPQVRIRVAGPGFFETFGATLIRGRAVGEHDTPTSIRVVMVNEAFVRRYLDGLDPLVEELVARQPPDRRSIVGVYKNIANAEQFGGDVRPEIILPITQMTIPFTSFAVRTSGDPGLLTRSIQAAIHVLDREMPMAKVRTMEQIVNEATAFDRFELALYGSFGVLALLLAVMGVYGLMAFVVSQRTSELGMRMALGADAASVFRLVLKDGMKLAIAGLALGTAGAYYATRLLSGSVYGTKDVDAVTLLPMAGLLLAAAICASIVPAWRASLLDPLQTLRGS